jgi:6-phosphogluconolactonase
MDRAPRYLLDLEMAYDLRETGSNQEFVTEAVDALVESIVQVLDQKDSCVLGLSGGSTPGPIYTDLGESMDIDWNNVWVFLVDERYTDSKSADSNQHLVRSTLLTHARIPEEHLLFPDTSKPLPDCVAGYAATLEEIFGDGSPDIVTLGFGPDGHIASLFPPLTQEAFSDDGAIHTTTEQFAVHDRISVTLPVLQAAEQRFFFLSGAAKQTVWQEMLDSSESATRWPAKPLLEKGNTICITKR